ncbi:hypothetical protein QFC21_001409 [Naganishia friedmannii]|uniref:Uncharacterized protein n=1 Tax=Naganishia friedmannii TaxID=89922 RepID=A0ACC2W4Q7_9TREE|nr:hypothetical protein QFC21_001409 [Naganishia friedmannii]
MDLSKSIDYSALRGKTALITGAAGGLGRGMALEWAKNGATVVVADLNEKAGKETVDELKRISGSNSHTFIKCNVVSWEAQVAMFKQAISSSPNGGIDIVVANAGIGESDKDVFSLDGPKEPKKPNLLTLDVDLNALVYTSHLAYWAFGQANKESQSSRTGTLLLLGSVASLTNTPETPLYGAAKHGVLGLFRSLRTPHLFTETNRNKSKDGKTNVTVNLLCPYFTDTNIIRDESGKKSLPDFVQLSKIEKVIEAATRLVTDKEGGKALVIMPKELAKGRGKDGIWQLERLQAKL